MRHARLLLPLVLLAAPALGLLHADPADPAERRLKFGSVSLYTENDKYFAGSDQYYTNGFKLSFLSAPIASFTAEPVPAPIRAAARALGDLLPPGRDYKLGLSLGQNIYTPTNIHTPVYQPDDRPYAAWLYVGSCFQVYTPPRILAAGTRSIGRLDTFEITLGMVGPAAIGRQIQNGVHDLLGIAHAEGWDNQIHNEPGLNLVYERKYRFATQDARTGWGADFIPHTGLSLGNIFTYANAGLEVRAGYRLPADFGTDLIRPSGDSSPGLRPRFAAFLFGAVDGRAVARDITLDGNTFRDSHSIPKEPLVADALAGLAIGTHHWQFTYAQALRTKEFKGQPKHSVFGSISVSYFY